MITLKQIFPTDCRCLLLFLMLFLGFSQTKAQCPTSATISVIDMGYCHYQVSANVNPNGYVYNYSWNVVGATPPTNGWGNNSSIQITGCSFSVSVIVTGYSGCSVTSQTTTISPNNSAEFTVASTYSYLDTFYLWSSCEPIYSNSYSFCSDVWTVNGTYPNGTPYSDSLTNFSSIYFIPPGNYTVSHTTYDCNGTPWDTSSADIKIPCSNGVYTFSYLWDLSVGQGDCEVEIGIEADFYPEYIYCSNYSTAYQGAVGSWQTNTGTIQGDVFLWEMNYATLTIPYNDSADVIFQATDTYGCMVSDTLHIAPPLPYTCPDIYHYLDCVDNSLYYSQFMGMGLDSCFIVNNGSHQYIASGTYLSPGVYNIHLSSYSVCGVLCGGYDATITIECPTVSYHIENCNELYYGIDGTVGGAGCYIINANGTYQDIYSGDALSFGTYTLHFVTYTDCGMYCGEYTATVTIGPPANLAIIGNTQICAGQSTTLSVSNSLVLCYWYDAWGQLMEQFTNSITVSPTTTTDYQYTYMSETGCWADFWVTVFVNPPPSVTSPNVSACIGQPINLGVSSTSSNLYQWTGPNSFTSPGANPSIPNASANMAGTYSVTATNSDGCTASTTTNVTINPLPIISATGSSTSIGGTILLAATGGTSYAWSGPNSFTSNLNNPSIPNATLSMSGTYSVTVTNANGCTASSTANVSVIPPTVTIIANGATSFCAGGSLILFANASSGLNFQWKKDGIAIPGAVNTTYTATQAGVYTLAVSTTGYTNTSNAITVTILPAPVANAGLDKTICYGGAATSIGTAAVTGNTYSWTPTAGLNSSITATPTANPTATTIYTLTAKNTATGCTATDQVEVYKNALLNINAGADQSICIGSSASLNAVASGGTAPYIYTWTPSTTVSAPTNATTNVTPTANTNYTAKVTDAKGCIKTDIVLVNVKALPTANAGTTQLSCGGSAVQIGSAAIAGYTYTWTPSAGLSNANISNPTASVTSATTYTVTAFNNGCQKTASVLVNAQTIPTSTIISASPASVCQGTAVTLTCAANGATVYKWYNATTLAYLATGATYTIPATTAAGTYSYICRTYTSSTNTCYATSNTLNVTIKDAPVPTIAASNGILSGTNLTVCYSKLPIIFTGSVSGTYQPSSWLWQFSGTNAVNSYTNIVNGTTPTLTAYSKDYYQLKVTYPNGCTKTALRRIILNVGCRIATQDSIDKKEEIIDSLDVLRIFPNPTEGLINLHLDNILFETAKVKVFNSLGQLVLETELNFEEGEQEKTVDLSNLDQGIYYLHFITNNEEVIKKVVKI